MHNQAIQIITFKPTSLSTEKGRWLLDSGDLVLPEGFKAAQSAIVSFRPRGWAANHRHQRREVLLGMAGDLYLVWRDFDGTRHERKMMRADGLLQFFVIASGVPHLIENRSANAPAVLQEWSDVIDESIPLENGESLRA